MRINSEANREEVKVTVAATSTPAVHGSHDLFITWVNRPWVTKAWPGVAVPMPGMMEQALDACHSVVKANQAAAAAMGDTLLRQQEITFGLARAALDALPRTTADLGLDAQQASWTKMMKGYTQACNQGLAAGRAVAEAALNSLNAAPDEANGGRTEAQNP
ncbi:hypothetical protein J8J14_10435 [Roseomonas sp. SSH11]|uniref:Phasin domain-containing protein n=1 Tax=Pararoseomonas baculiformis TaxID=2820812 RepID=A0ABS4ADX0_9PROT|nr:hypothetical protein [Pararoseomonas baculiformis]MBP0445197.1 hypothetical protein [Pararoseomonas baculiformis]